MSNSDYDDLDAEILKEFLAESHEGLDRLDDDFSKLQQNPSDGSLMSGIFRTMHTIKGTAGPLGFPKLEKVAHSAEHLLSRIRDGELVGDEVTIDTLLAVVDAIRAMLESVEQSGDEGDQDVDGLVADLGRLAAGQTLAAAPVEAATPESEPAAPVPAPAPPAFVEPPPSVLPPSPARTLPMAPALPNVSRIQPMPDVEIRQADSVPVQGVVAPELTGFHRKLSVAPVAEAVPQEDEWSGQIVRETQTVLGSVGELLVKRGAAGREEVLRAIRMQRRGDARRLGEILVDMGVTTLQAVEEALKEQTESRGKKSNDNIRVDVDLLDNLMNLVGELVLVRNQIDQFADQDEEDRGFHLVAHRLDLITSELQEGVMKTRMQQISSIWNKFPRMLRHLAQVCGKKVNLEMEGKETDLDRNIIDAIKDPLTHIVRNSVDHGLESRDERRASGKPANGTITLRAYHEGGRVNIQVSDDGKGIDPEAVKAKAQRLGLLNAVEASRLRDRDLIKLIFTPGFSTAAQVTSVSGRGVGMDVVKSNIERIGGSIDIDSRVGLGTTLTMKIPLTLAIIPVLIVSAGGDRFALPQVSLLEVVRVELSEAEHQIEEVHGTRVYRLRGDLLPLVYLHEQLELDAPDEPDVLNVVVLQAGTQVFGLVVDHISDTAEIVVKPLSCLLKKLGVYAGATILGDGNLALILDVLGLAKHAGVVVDTAEQMRRTVEAIEEQDESVPAQQFLLLGLGDSTRLAMPLQHVSRLEELPSDGVRRVTGHDAIQYRGQVLPLIYVDEALGLERMPHEDGVMQVCIFCHRGRSVGLIVHRVIDVVEERIVGNDAGSYRRGIYTSAVIADVVTDVVDVPAIVMAALPGFFEGGQSAA